MKRRPAAPPLLRTAFLLLGLIGFGAAWPVISPAANLLLERAALFTTVLDMPAGAIETLRERYDAEMPAKEPLLPPEENTPETEPPPAEEPSAVLPEIPAAYRGTVSEITMTGEDTSAYCRWNNAWIRNYTDLTNEEITAVLQTPNKVTLTKSAAPQILLFHTHTTESYEPYDRTEFDIRSTWRDEENQNNMAAVGEVLQQALADCGIAALHDTTQHDNPSYTGAYNRSTQTIKAYQKEYSELRILLDLHRDAILYSDTSIAKTVTTVNGKKAAQLMIIAPYDDGSLGIRHWRENFRFAAALTDAIETAYPGLMRPVFFASRSYNFACSDGALLLEFGTNGNTLEEAKYTAELIAPILAEVLAG